MYGERSFWRCMGMPCPCGCVWGTIVLEMHGYAVPLWLCMGNDRSGDAWVWRVSRCRALVYTSFYWDALPTCPTPSVTGRHTPTLTDAYNPRPSTQNQTARASNRWVNLAWCPVDTYGGYKAPDSAHNACQELNLSEEDLKDFKACCACWIACSFPVFARVSGDAL